MSTYRKGPTFPPLPKLTPQRRGYIEAFMVMARDLPDGAFFGLAQETGISVEELAAHSDQEDG